MAEYLSYKDISHPTYNETIKAHNAATLKLVKTVAEFAQRISQAHEQFASQIQSVVELFHNRNQELKKERVKKSGFNKRSRSSIRRTVPECHSTLSIAWETLLQETQNDAQSHTDTANLLIKNVCNPLFDIAQYKKSQSKKLFSFREGFEKLLQSGEENVHQCGTAYMEAYQDHRSNMNTRDAAKHTSAYSNAHNDNILQLKAANCLQHEYHHTALPYLLQELEEIHIDLANTCNGAIESHALLLLTKATEQSQRFEGILKICNKQVNPKLDVHNFLLTLSEKLVPYTAKNYTFTPASDPSIPGSELGAYKEQIIVDRFTEANITNKQRELQKEAVELTSYIKQNQDVTQTLTNVCQRNLANHQHAKVYETQEDLCRKRNEIRMANIQLEAVRAQIDLLSPKPNGRTMEDSGENAGENKTTIRWMWKKAFKSLKTKDRDKEKEKEKMRDDRSDKSSEREEKRAYGRMNSRQSSVKKSLLKRKDSKEQPAQSGGELDEEPELTDKVGEIDPVYSLLKCAADLPRQNKGQQHACCMQRATDSLTVRVNSRSSSPSSVSLVHGISTSSLSVKSELHVRSASSSPRIGGTARKGDVRIRRVKFQQDSRKSQSLETPYHHTHHQKKLGRDIGVEVTERSRSYSSIASQAHVRPPPVLTTQHSLSGGNISEHEKWEKEGGMEYTIRRGKRPLTVSNKNNDRGSPGKSKGTQMTHLAVVHPQRPRRELRHQRSYSTGDLSPTIEKWEKESVVDLTNNKGQDKARSQEAREHGSTESPREDTKKTVTDRRKGWVKQKQKSKSFDFSWRMGGMWSPVEDRKVNRREVILLQSEPRHPRPKPPSMLELDSGSSYESRDISFAKKNQSMLRVGESMDVSTISKSPISDRTPRTPMDMLDEVVLRELEFEGKMRDKAKGMGEQNRERQTSREDKSRDASHEEKSRDSSRHASRGGSAGSQKSPSAVHGLDTDRRRSVFTERKSHSLDSSLEDYHSSSQEKDPDLVKEEGAIQYVTMTAKDRRLKLQEQRRSRSLDTYEPQQVSFKPMAPIHRSSSRSKEKVLDVGSQTRRKSRQDLTRSAHESTQRTATLEEPASRSRRASDFVTGHASRRPSDAPSGQHPRRASDFVSSGANVHRRASDAVQKSSSRHASDARSTSKRSTDCTGSSPATRRRSDVGGGGRGSPSQRRTTDTGAVSGRGSPSLRSSDRSGSGSPSRRQAEPSQRERTDQSKRGSEAKKAFTQQKSFSFEVGTKSQRIEHVVRDTRLKTMPESACTGIKPRPKGRMLPKIPAGTDRSPENTSPRRQVEKTTRTKDKRSRFAEQKSFSCDSPAQPPQPQVISSHRKSEPAFVAEFNRRRDYIEESELPTHIRPNTKHHSAANLEISKDTSPEHLAGGPRSPRSRNVRQEAVDRVSTARAATSPAAFSLSMQQQTSLAPIGRSSPQREHARDGLSPKVSPREGSSPHRMRKCDSMAVTSDRSPQESSRNTASRRKNFSGQKSFSYEVATTYQPLNGEQDYTQVTRARTARDKRLIMMQTRASHSLDDIDYQKQMQAQMQVHYNQGMFEQPYSHFPPPLGYMYMGQYLPPHYPPDVSHMSRRYDNNLHVDDQTGHSRSPSRSPDRGRDKDRDASPRGSRSKLMMMHSMKAQDGGSDGTVTHGSMSPPQGPLSPPHMMSPNAPTSPKPGYPMPLHHDYRLPVEGMYPPHPYYGYPPMYDDPRFVPQGFYMDERYMPRGYPTQFLPPGYPHSMLDPSLRSTPADVPKQGSSGDQPLDESGQQQRSPRESSTQPEPPPEPKSPEFDFEKPIVVGPTPAVLIKPLPRDALRKDRYADGKPFWKFWKS